MRERPVRIARSSAKRTLWVPGTSTMSMRGTITSRTMVSPNSMTERMKLRSSEAMAASSWATSAIASTSDSVTRWAWPGLPNRPITPWAIESRSAEIQRMGQSRRMLPTIGAAVRAAVSGCATA